MSYRGPSLRATLSSILAKYRSWSAQAISSLLLALMPFRFLQGSAALDGLKLLSTHPWDPTEGSMQAKEDKGHQSSLAGDGHFQLKADPDEA